MHKNLSTAVAFVDLVTAFASMRRCLAVPGDDASDQCWKQHLMAIGFTQDETDAAWA